MQLNNITIITTCYNNPEELHRTLKSISAQTTAPAKHLVVDSSSPAVSERAKKMARHAGAIYLWVPPEGIYDAMNRGIEKALPGSYVWFINSSDMLAHPASMSVMAQNLEQLKTDGPDWIVGGLFRVRKFGISSHNSGSDSARFARKMKLGSIGFPHPSTLMSEAFLKSQGGFDTRYQIAGDYDVGLKALGGLGPPALFDFPVSIHFPGGISYSRPFRNWFEKGLARFRNLSPLDAVMSNLSAIIYVGRGFLRRYLITSEPSPPNHFLELFADPTFHFCGLTDSIWPQCCIDFLDRSP